MHPRRIIFVYGSTHRLFDLVVGWSHKTSASREVSLSHGELHGLLTVWGRFMRLLPCAAEFIEICETCEQPPFGTTQSPLILIEYREVVEVLVHSHDIHHTDSVSGLMTLVEIRLEEWRARTFFRQRESVESTDHRLPASDGSANDRPAQPNPAELCQA